MTKIIFLFSELKVVWCVCRRTFHYCTVHRAPANPSCPTPSWLSLECCLKPLTLLISTLFFSPNTPEHGALPLLTAAPMKLVATYGRSSHQHRSAPPARLSRNNLLTSVALLSLLLPSHWGEEKKNTTRRIRLASLSNLAVKQSLLEIEIKRF